MRRFRGIPYMNEFRSVKQGDDRRLEPPDFTRQRPVALRAGWLPHRDVHAAVRAIADCALQQQSAQASIAFFIWDNIRCDVIYLGCLLLPDIR
jgi:hypothetical protein